MSYSAVPHSSWFQGEGGLSAAGEGTKKRGRGGRRGERSFNIEWRIASLLGV